MFDKNKFAQIIKNIKENYLSQEEFAKRSGIGRTYLSQYMNMKLDKPPKPEILEKLANASHKITNYNELMQVCGYLEDDFYITLQNLEDKANEQHDYYLNKLVDFKLPKEDEKIYDDLAHIINFYELIPLPDSKINEKLNSYFDNMDYVTEKSKSKIVSKLKLFVDYFVEQDKINKEISDFKFDYKHGKSKEKNNKNFYNIVFDKISNNQFFLCPVYGKISAGQPNWAEECLDGYLPIDPTLMNINSPDECFFLRVNGQSMNKIIKDGAYALIRKTDFVENGEIAVVLVNGFDATLKKFTKQGDVIVLEPMSDDPTITTQVYNKDTSIKVIGKYLGKFEINQ